MIVNKSMYPLATGFSVISKMQNQFATLQMQLGTGDKAQTLSEMGRDLPVSLSVRSRLSAIEGYRGSIEQVNLRLSFYDSALSRMDKLEGEARNSAVQGQYGTNNINMGTISGLSRSRLDEMVTMLNGDVGGRYLFGGSTTDKAPLPTSNELLNGAGGRAGFQTVVTERKMADAGADNLGRLATALDASDPSSVKVTLSEDGQHPFGLKLSTVSAIGGSPGYTPHLGVDPADIAFAFSEAAPVAPGASITLGFTMPDGSETQITLKAAQADKGVVGEFAVGATAAETAAAFQAALRGKLEDVSNGELAAASTFAASENFFNAAGEPVLRVETGSPSDPYTATALRVGTAADTVMWYGGSTAAVSAVGMGRLGAERTDETVTLSEQVPVSSAHGFRLTAASAGSNVAPSPGTAPSVGLAGDPAVLSVAFTQLPTAGDRVTLSLTEPGGRTRDVTLTAVAGKAGPGQFTIGASADDAAANFQQALVRSVTDAAAEAEGNPRQSVSASVEDSGRVNYGMQANENGYLRLMRSLAAMAVETYPEISLGTASEAEVKASKIRFDAMAIRQQSQLSEARNTERGSIEIVTMELGIARVATNAATARHTSYKAQLDNLLSDVETVSKEDVAMEIMALQTRLTASYQVTSMVSQLSLVNFLR